MTDSLFRHEAVVSQRQLQHYGQGSAVPPPAHWLVAASAALVMAAVGSLLYFGTYTSSEPVRGYLEPDAGTRRIFVPRTGLVSALLVDNGVAVARGAPLMRISAERPAHGRSVDEQVIAALEEQLSGIRERVARNALRQLAQRESFAAQIINSRRVLVMLEAQLQLQEEISALDEKQSDRITKLASRGHLPALDVHEQRSKTLLRSQEHLELLRRVSELQAEIDRQAAAQHELRLREQDELTELHTQRLRLKAELATAEGAATFTLTAAVAGVISGLQVRQGDRVTSATPVLTIIPPHSRFRAVLLVPSRARGLVTPGDHVRIRVDAFPYQTFGVVPGHVVAVSQSPLLPGDTHLPVPVTEASYRVDVALAQAPARQGGASPRFAAGMTVAADLLRERRRIFEWLFAPLLQGGHA